MYAACCAIQKGGAVEVEAVKGWREVGDAGCFGWNACRIQEERVEQNRDKALKERQFVGISHGLRFFARLNLWQGLLWAK